MIRRAIGGRAGWSRWEAVDSEKESKRTELLLLLEALFGYRCSTLRRSQLLLRSIIIPKKSGSRLGSLFDEAVFLGDVILDHSPPAYCQLLATTRQP